MTKPAAPDWVITIVAPIGRTVEAGAIAAVREAAGTDAPIHWIDADCVCDVPFVIDGDGSPAPLRARLAPILDAAGLDWAMQPSGNRIKALLVADMDSTMIGQECINELADFAGVGDDVARITEQAMRGELDFEQALRARVAQLAGLEESVLERTLRERISVTPGARTLLATMRANGAFAVLVSGGFTFFAERLADDIGFDAARANRLLVENGRLTGKVAEPILGRDAKRDTLHEHATRLGLSVTETAAVGDGANDLAMIEAAGLGVAYRAKPVVAERADARIEHGDLTALLSFQGISRDRLVTVP